MAAFRQFISTPTFRGSTGTPVDPALNNTDVILPVVKLYIEGVQVPFESISISNSYQALPSAEIQIPPTSGLIDITRGYEPKVHVFFEDVNYGGDRLLFWGIIKSCSYSRSRAQGSAFISFHCEHRISLLNQITLDYTGWASPTNANMVDANQSDSIVKPASMNSNMMIIEALKGVSGVASEQERIVSTNASVSTAPTDKIDPSLQVFEKRLEGMPGVALNLWNQLKKGAAQDPLMNLALSKMYIPLLEEGLSFFKRFSGHYSLEKDIQNGKQPYCHGNTQQEAHVVVPPCFRNAIMSAQQQEISVRSLASIVGFSGELTSLLDLLNYFYGNAQYDMSVLSSPAEINVDPESFNEDASAQGIEKTVVETIVKPQIPFYFSPTCNVLLPRMYSDIQINQDEGSVPTRVTAFHEAMPSSTGEAGLGTNIRSPSSIREAVAYNSALKGGVGNTDVARLSIASTRGYSYSIPGKYEQGVGVRPQKISLPWWLVILVADKSSRGVNTSQESFPAHGTESYNDMMVLSKEWENRHAKKLVEDDGTIQSSSDNPKKGLNPYDPLNKEILPFERILIGAADYEYTKRIVGSRTGFVGAVFNPYIIPGYPMEIVDDNPNHPSFHAFCTSVTHTITSNQISTSIGFVGAVSYAELSNFYIPPIHPYLQTALNLVNAVVDEEEYSKGKYGDPTPFIETSSTLLQNPVGKATADQFYKEVLGVGACAPDDLMHFSTGRAFSVNRAEGILRPEVLPDKDNTPNRTHYQAARETKDYYSTVGNLRLVRRPIESKVSIEDKFGLSFIDIDPALYNNTYVNYVNPKLAKNLYLEPGASLFLDYVEINEFINQAKEN